MSRRLVFTINFIGNIPLALDLTNKLLEIFPTHPRAKGNKVYYEEEIQRTNTVKRKGEEEILPAFAQEDVPRLKNSFFSFLFVAGCL